jgi:Protein kinase domain/WD40-like Beta Propeller Repeat
MNNPDSDSKDSVTEVAEESFVRERPPEIERGTVLAGRYQIEDIIGKGGSGIVLRVFDRTAQNVVALKVLKTELARDTKWERRFSRELRLGRPIQHRNVCRIFDIGEAEGHRFLTMELARGGSLRDELRRDRSVERPIADRLTDARAAIEGLAAIHAAGVVHRDFKPDNLLRMEDGRLVISDFGLATDAANAPGTTVLIGTPHYMAPEVLAGEPATSRSDVWALGVVLYEIFFGRRPERRSVSFDGSGKGPLRPSSSAERAILWLCERCLADAPLDRPADAGAVAEQFNAALTSRGGPRRTRRRGLLVGGLTALVALGGLFAVKIQRRGGTRESAENASGLVRLLPTGHAVDWSKTTKIVAEIPGRVHCFSMLNTKTARLVWGAPRRAEDVDLDSGQRRPSELDPESYRFGCPELSPSGRALLFTGQNQAGAVEIRLSNTPDGRSAKTMTSGSDPLWFGDDEFVYDIDQGHAAIFSLPTMGFALLRDSEFGTRHGIQRKVVDPEGGAIALLLCDEGANYAVALYHGKDFELERTFAIRDVRLAQFVPHGKGLWISYWTGESSTLGVLDWQRGSLANVGHYPGFQIAGAQLSDPVAASGDWVLVRHMSNDLWSYSGDHRERLTTQGDNYSGDRSSSGELLLSKWNGDGSMNIWRQGLRGDLKQITHGQNDLAPRFAPDGRSWVYVDYAQRNVVVCSFDDGRCNEWPEGELPSFPSLSPDGRNLAYVTQMGVQKLKVRSVDDGRVLISWDAYSSECAPVWSSSSKLWSLESSAGHYGWSEHEITTGAKTGKQLAVDADLDASGRMRCWPKAPDADSPFFRRIGVETTEVSRLVRFN